MRCVLVGNYGVGNIGDEALKEYFLSNFPGIEWKVVCSLPNGFTDHTKIPRLPLGLRSLFHPWWRTVSAIARADAVVFGGGSLFTDIESVWAGIIWGAYAALAQFFHVPYIMAFQGAGPWKTALGLRLAMKTYCQAAFVSVRDKESLARIQSFGLIKPPVLTFDPAFALFAGHERKSVGKRLVVIPRTNSDENFFAEVSKKLLGNFSDVRILLMQPNAEERRVGERLRKLSGDKATVIELKSVTQFLDEVSGAAEVISQRYHGALAALAMEKATIICSQKPGDKLDGLRKIAKETSNRSNWLQAVRRGEDGLRQKLHLLGR